MSLTEKTLRWGLPLILAIAVAGCMGDGAPTTGPGSEATLGPSLDEGRLPRSVRDSIKDAEKAYRDSVKAAEKAERDSLEALRERERDRIKEERRLQREAYERARDEWKAFKDYWKDLSKADRRALELLRCEPKEYDGAAEIIGPEGGTIKVGPHKLVIPRNALSRSTVITAEARPATLVALDFSPHGLQFQRPATLSLNYSRCVVPRGQQHVIVYLGTALQLLSTEDSDDDDEVKEVRARIEHFSKYAVAYRK